MNPQFEKGGSGGHLVTFNDTLPFREP